jgi:hypothetical protein
MCPTPTSTRTPTASRDSSPRGSTGGHRWRQILARLGPSASSSWCEINRDNYVAATSTSTSAASDNCCWGSPPYRGARAQRPPPAGDPPQAGNVCSFELGTGKPALGRSGNCAPTSLTRRGTQMDLGPPALYCRRHVTIGKCRTIHKPPSTSPHVYVNAKRAERLLLAAAHGFLTLER